MQEESKSFQSFFDRTQALARELRLNVSDLPAKIEVSASMFHSYRSGKYPISDKAWRKLEAAERAAGIPGDEERAGKVKDLEGGTGEKIRHLTDEELFPHIGPEELADFRERLVRLMAPAQKAIQEFPMAELLRHMEAAGAYPPFSPEDGKLTFAKLWQKYAPTASEE